MQKRQLLINAVVGVGQVVVSAGAFVVLYAFIERRLGLEALGIWGIVQALARTTVTGNLGMNGGATKFIAQYAAHGQHDYISTLVQTALLATAGAMLGMVLLIYAFLEVLIPFTLEYEASPEQMEEALTLMPLALSAFWLSTMGGVILGCLDGFQRVDLGSYLMMITTMVYVGFGLWWIPSYGLVGLAYAQVVQMSVLCIGGWLVLRRLAPNLPWLPIRWRTAAFKEMISYNVKFQVISFSLILFDPVTKTLMVRFGSLSAAGFYEAASRMVIQLRALVNTAHRAVVPTIADLQERAPEKVRRMYTISFRLVVFLVTLAVPGLIALVPVVAEVWLADGYHPMFMGFAVILLAAWFLNLLSNPAYYANLGTGELRWNVIAHIAIGGLNVVLGMLLGYAFGAYGVVAAFALALLIGSSITAVSYHVLYNIRLHQLLETSQLMLLGWALAGGAAGLLLFFQTQSTWPWWAQGVAIGGLYFGCVGRAAWQHPMGKQVRHWALVLAGRG